MACIHILLYECGILVNLKPLKRLCFPCIHSAHGLNRGLYMENMDLMVLTILYPILKIHLF